MFDSQFTASGIPTERLLTCDNADDTEQFFLSVQKECVSNPKPDPEVIRHLISLWLIQLKRLLNSRQAQNAIPPAWLDIKQYLDEHFAESITLQMLADRVCLSRQHFCRVFKHYFEIPAIEYLKQRRLEHARFLLLDCNLSIADIAFKVGYNEYGPFSTHFLRHFGVSARNMRKGMNGEAAREHLATERRNVEFARWTQGGWALETHADFANAVTLAPQWQASYFSEYSEHRRVLFPAPELAELSNGVLCLHPRKETDWTEYCLQQDVGEETKVAVRVANTSPDGLNLAIAISGNLQTGYRLRIYHYDHIVFETMRHGSWEFLYRCPVTLDPQAESYTFVLWRAANIFYAELDGQRIMTYLEPLAAFGGTHRTVSLGRKGLSGGACIHSLYVWSRRMPRFVDILEPGRAFLRQGYRDEALAWFRKVAEEHTESDIRHEARYLATLAIPEARRAEKIDALQAVVEESDSPFRPRALRALSLQHLRGHDLQQAIACARQFQTIAPDDGLFQQMAQTMLDDLGNANRAEQQVILQHMACLPITELLCQKIALSNIDALQGMPLTSLHFGPGCIEDLSPLKGMPLTSFSCNYNQVADLTPLTGMPLKDCSVVDNRITDLAPLAGMPLISLQCPGNNIHDLSPLVGAPLQKLSCALNQISDLTPVSAMPLAHLNIDANHVHDIRPLASLPLTALYCSWNPIDDLSCLTSERLEVLYCNATGLSDLSSIAQLPLTQLACGANAISDLTPLAGMPLISLDCTMNPITNLTPLAKMPLTVLHTGAIPLHGANGDTLAALPLHELFCDLNNASLPLIQAHPTLQSVNGHTRTHVLAVMPTVLRAVDTWHTQPDAPLPNRCVLREFAVPVGDHACLALPIAFPWPEAAAFCHWQGGRLVCPSTEAYYAELMQYLSTVIDENRYVCHTLGLSCNPSDHSIHWLSGAPYNWHRWRPMEEHHIQDPAQRFPSFYSNVAYDHLNWWHIGETPTFIVIEWDR